MLKIRTWLGSCRVEIFSSDFTHGLAIVNVVDTNKKDAAQYINLE